MVYDPGFTCHPRKLWKTAFGLQNPSTDWSYRELSAVHTRLGSNAGSRSTDEQCNKPPRKGIEALAYSFRDHRVLPTRGPITTTLCKTSHPETRLETIPKVLA